MEPGTFLRAPEYEAAYDTFLETAIWGVARGNPVGSLVRIRITRHGIHSRNVIAGEQLEFRAEQKDVTASLLFETTRNSDLETHTEMVAALGQAHGEAMEAKMLSDIVTVAETSGNTITASGGHFNYDNFLDLIEQAPMAFDADENALTDSQQFILPLALKETLKSLTMTQAHQERYDEIIKNKRIQWRATLKTRRLTPRLEFYDEPAHPTQSVPSNYQNPLERSLQRVATEYDDAYVNFLGLTSSKESERTPFLSGVPVKQSRHLSSLRYVTDQVYDIAATTIENAFSLTAKAILNASFIDFQSMLNSLVRGSIKAKTEILGNAMIQGTDMSGNALLGDQSLTWENILRMYERLDVSFDDDGNPSQFQVFGGAEAISRLQSEPKPLDYDFRMTQLIEAKRRSYFASKRTRILSR